MPFGFLALLAAFGTLANSLRSNSASVLIRTLLRCSARPNGGGYLSARPLRGPRPNGLLASRTSPEWLVRFANFARMARPLRELRPNGLLASLTSRSAGVASFLTPHCSQGHGTPCPYDLTPTTSLLTPHSYDLTPHSSLLTPHSSLLTPLASLHPSFRACPGICLAVAACTLPPAPHGARARARHAVPLRPHPQGNHKGCPYDLTPHKGTARRATTA